jgi:putative restriction endonuclease
MSEELLDVWLSKFFATRRDKKDGIELPYQRDCLIWFLQEVRPFEPRLKHWNDIKGPLNLSVNPDVVDVGSYPLVALSLTGVLEIVGLDQPLTAHGHPYRKLNEQNPVCGLPKNIFNLLMNEPSKIEVAISRINEYFEPVGVPLIDENSIPIGTQFLNRKELITAGLHKHLQRGISSNRGYGATSIVLSGGYLEDEDYGDVIIYTGQGGRDNETRKQIANQTMAMDNLELKIAFENQTPIKVIRGFSGDKKYSPTSGYRYDGEYLITKIWPQIGSDGFRLWRFKLEASPGEDWRFESFEIGNSAINISEEPTLRKLRTSNQLVRDPKISQKVKSLYGYHCQVCDLVIETPMGPYSEAAHIKALGSPDNGPDELENVLCLCPNHHKSFDKYGWYIDDDLTIHNTLNRETIGILTLDRAHKLNKYYLAHHRKMALNAFLGN